MSGRLVGVLACPLIAGVFLAAPLLSQSTQSAWKEYSYPRDGFAVSAPVKPVLNKQERTLEIALDNSVVTISLSPADAHDVLPRAFLQGAKNGLLGKLHAKLVSEKDITLQGCPGIQFDYESAKSRLRSRIYVAKKIVFTLMAGVPKGRRIPDSVNRIFDSLRLLNAPACK